MTKEDYLQILKLLSALETQLFACGTKIPDHLFDGLEIAMKNLEREILK